MAVLGAGSLTATALGQVAGDYRSVVPTGAWGSPSTWQTFDGLAWIPASSAPGGTNNVFIQAGTNVTVTAITEACDDLNLSTSATLTLSTNDLLVNGSLNSVTSSADIFPVGYGTSPAPHNISSSGTGALRVVGLTRSLTVSDHWGHGTTDFTLEIALANPLQTVSLNTEIQAATLVVTTGTLDARSNSIQVDNGSFGGPVFIAPHATVRSAASGLTPSSAIFLGTSSRPIQLLVVQGTLELSGAQPSLVAQNSDFTLGTVDFDRDGPQDFIVASPIPGSQTPLVYGHVVLGGSGTKTLVASATTSIAANGSLEMGGTISAPVLVIPGGSSLSVSSSGTTLSYTSQAGQITGPELNPNFRSLVIRDHAGVTMTADFAVSGTLTLADGSLSLGTHTLTLNGPVIESGGSINGDVGSTVNYNQPADGQLVAAGTYFNLNFNPVGSFTRTLSSSTIVVRGDWTVGTVSAINPNGGVVQFGGASPQTIDVRLNDYSNLVIDNASGVTMLGPASLTVTSQLQFRSGSLNVGAGNSVSMGDGGLVAALSGNLATGSNGGTLVFLGHAAVSGAVEFNNVRMLAVSAVDFDPSSSVDGVLELDAGAVVENHRPPLFHSGSTLLMVGGQSIGDMWRPGAGGPGVPDNVTVTAGTLDFNPVASNSPRHALGSLSVTSTGGLTLGSSPGGDLTVGGSFTVGGGGTFTASGRVLTFDGTGSWVCQSSGQNFGDVTIDKSAGGSVRPIDPMVVLGDLTVTAGTLDLSGAANTVGGTTRNSSHVIVSLATFRHLHQLPGGTLDTSPGALIHVSGDLTNDGTFNPGTSSVFLDGPDHSIGGATATRFHNFDKGPGSVTMSADLSVDGTLTLPAGVIFTGSNTLHILPPSGSVLHVAGSIEGNEQKYILATPLSQAMDFELSNDGRDHHVTVALDNISHEGTFTVSTTATLNPDIAHSGLDPSKLVHLNVSVRDNDATFGTESLTLNWVTSDQDPGFNPVLSACRQAAGQSTWTQNPAVARTPTSITVTVTNPDGQFAVGNPGCPVITLAPPSPLANGTRGSSHGPVTIVPSAGAPPIQFTVSAGALPTGMALDLATGSLHGTPLASGSFSFTVTAIDNNGCTGSQAYALTINPATFAWIRTGTGDWTDASSWSPARTSTATDDILLFNNGANTIATNIPTQTVAQIVVTSSTTLHARAGATNNVLTVGGDGSPAADLRVDPNSTWSQDGASPLQVSVCVSATADVQGSIVFQTSAQRMDAVSPSAIVFESGSSMTASSGFSGNVFGNTGTASVAIFTSGSTFTQASGANPFGPVAPAPPKCVFQHGSLYIFAEDSPGLPSFAGRVYSGFRLNNSGTMLAQSVGVLGVDIDNLTITSGGLNLGLTSAPVRIHGDITVASGASLLFDPSPVTVTSQLLDLQGNITVNGTGVIDFNSISGTVPTQLNLDGGSLQTFGGTGTITCGSNLANTTVLNPSGVALDHTLTLPGALTVSAGQLNVLSPRALTLNAASSIGPSGSIAVIGPGATLALGQGLTNNGALNVSGTLQINTNGFVNVASATPPSYATGSLLRYNSGGLYGRSKEWSSTSGPGYPSNVEIASGTTLELANLEPSTAKAIAGDLNIAPGAGLTMSAMSAPLTVNGSGGFTCSGTATLSTVSGGDLHVFGSLAFPTPGSLVTNNRTISFEGGATQLVSRPGGVSLDYIRLSKSAGSVQLSTDVFATAPAGGISLRFDGSIDVLDLNGHSLTLAGTVAGTNASGALRGSPASSLTLNGTGAMGMLQFAPGGQALGTLAVNRTNSGSISIGSDLTVGGSLNLNDGLVDMGASTLHVTSAMVTRANGWVIGAMERSFPGPLSERFDVGTANGYSPVTVNATGGAGTFKVQAKQGAHPNAFSSNILQRYWTLTNSGLSAADLTFAYLASDVVGTESAYEIARDDSHWTHLGGTVNTGLHTASIAGQTVFSSDWTLGTCPTITIAPPAGPLAAGLVGSSYSQTVTATGAALHYVYSISSGSPPPGMALAPDTGVISGMPSAAGTSNFTITATDANNCTASQAYSIKICPVISLTSPPLPDGTVGGSYSASVTASGGTSPYTYAITSGTFPPLLMFNIGNGQIIGSPGTAGTFNFTVRATDANGCTASQAYSIKICPVITLSSLPDGAQGVSYSQTVTASGGTPPYSFARTGGALPAGLSLASGGAVTGLPSAGGTSTFTLSATDANGCTGSQTYSLIVPFIINASAGANGTINPSGAVPVNPGGSQTFSFAPNTGFAVANVIVDGVSVGAPPSVPFNNVAANHTISVTFAPTATTHTITASAGPNGSIAPSGPVIVSDGNNQSFIIAANTGYHVQDVIVDGGSVGAVTSYNFNNVTTDHTISATFAINVYTITASAGPNGSINPTGAVPVNHGASQSFTMTADPGYHVADVIVDGSSVGATSSYTFSSVTADHAITASFAINTFTITASAGSHGSIAPSGAVSVNQGTTPAFTITPDVGYHVSDVLVDGASVGAVTSYTFPPVTANHTIAASFAINTYTITATPGANGSITPSGSVTVAHGASQSFTISANAGFAVSDVVVDGSSVGNVSVYTFNNVTSNHTITASFVVANHTITASAGLHGSILPSGAVGVVHASNKTFIISPDLGYHVADVLVDGGSVGPLTSYTFINIIADHTISASFAIDTYTLVASAGPHGSINPIGTLTVNFGDNQSFSITPDPGYHVADVLVDGSSVGAVTSYLFSSINGSHTIAASFAINVYSIIASAGGNGSISPLGAVPASHGSTPSFIITPNIGFHIADVLVDGISVGAVASYTFPPVTSNHTIAASFAINTFTIAASAGPNGSIAPNGTVTENFGDNQLFAITPNAGFHVADVLVDGGSVGAVTSYFFTNVTANHSIAASFAAGAATDNIAAVPASASCISTPTPCVSVPVVFNRSNASPVRLYSVTFLLSSNLQLCGSGISEGPYLSSFGSTQFNITNNGGGSYTVDCAILGPGCGPTTTGTLFNVAVSSTSSLGTGTLTVTSTTARDCSNLPLPASPGTVASITIDKVPPIAVSNLAASQKKLGNLPADGTTDISLSFTMPLTATTSEVYRAPFGHYPDYDEAGGVTPTLPSYPPGTPWVLALAGPGIDRPPVRDFYYYVVFVKDACGNVSLASNITGGTLDYFLGDVHNGITNCQGDDHVTTADLSYLGAHYGAVLAVGSPFECLDVGPTTNLSVDARPTTDHRINFEDLIVMSVNFGVVSAPEDASGPPAAAANQLRLRVPSMPAVGSTFDVVLEMSAAGDVQGLSANFDFNRAVVEPSSVSRGELLDRQISGSTVLSSEPGNVDVALLGTGYGLSGIGDLATVTFRVKAAGDPAIGIRSAVARDADNRPIAIAGSGRTVGVTSAARAVTTLMPIAPNPFTRNATLGFSLAQTGEVELAIYSVDGRRVRTLLRDTRSAGSYHMTWEGADNSGKPVGPGVYFARLVTRDGRFSRTLLHVR